ncbi:hypothetical protein [Marinomonas ostreistagni]|uniref:hypothetical protein n=1 Tax=Marinomonas ostreistagni TaxID=359209 RepID=UPI00194E5548|nr:hypothetical protein [Marinomonas ostreistagni]MBM6549792.1 hypothetical protein [Marinomonas ostreistagni]
MTSVSLVYKISTSVLKDHFTQDTLGDIERDKWLEIDVSNPDHQALLIAHDVEVPFIDEHGRFLTHSDLSSSTTPLTFFQVSSTVFTASALRAAFELSLITSRLDDEAKAQGASLGADSSKDDYLQFSNTVCEWGRGLRVWANLKRHHGSNLSNVLKVWLSLVEALNDEQAIYHGASIKGLGVSFASKHLRFLDPERFVVLDDVFCQGLGIALNPKGYVLFLSMLRQLQQQLNLELTLGDLEQGLFYLVRQQVRLKA